MKSRGHVQESFIPDVSCAAIWICEYCDFADPDQNDIRFHYLLKHGDKSCKNCEMNDFCEGALNEKWIYCGSWFPIDQQRVKIAKIIEKKLKMTNLLNYFNNIVK